MTWCKLFSSKETSKGNLVYIHSNELSINAKDEWLVRETKSYYSLTYFNLFPVSIYLSIISPILLSTTFIFHKSPKPRSLDTYQTPFTPSLPPLFFFTSSLSPHIHRNSNSSPFMEINNNNILWNQTKNTNQQILVYNPFKLARFPRILQN